MHNVVGVLGPTKAVVPTVVVCGNDNQIHTKLKRYVRRAYDNTTGAEYPFAVWICCANEHPLLFQGVLRLALSLEELRLDVGSVRNFEGNWQLVNVKKSQP